MTGQNSHYPESVPEFALSAATVRQITHTARCGMGALQLLGPADPTALASI